MGVLATLAAALFPDYVGGTSIPTSPKLADLRSFAAAIDSAIPNAQDLSGVQNSIGTLNTAVTQLQAQAASVNDEMVVVYENITNFQTAAKFLTAENELRSATILELQTALSPLSANVTADRMLLKGRPGDAQQLYVASIDGGDPNQLARALGPVVTLDTGAALQISGYGYIAPRTMVPVSPNRVYRARWAARRTTDTADPSAPTVRFGLAWYGADGTVLAALTQSAAFDLPLTVARGRVEALTVFALAGSTYTDIVAPTGACYARPFVQVFGEDQASAVEELSIVDITDAGLIAPDVDALAARLAAVEAKLGITGVAA